MPVVLICAPDPLVDELHGTLLWRDGIERHVANRFEDALVSAVAAQPNLVVVDRDLPQAERLVEDLRKNPTTRHVSIAVVARGDMDPSELLLLGAGANAILRLPAGPDWDERVARLMSVAPRREARVLVRIEFHAETEGGIEAVSGTIQNISATGMLVYCTSPLPIGTDFDFSFRLPDGEPVMGCAFVVRVAGHDRFGVQFYALEGDGAERVQRFVTEEGGEAGF